jgi:flagellar hook-associated protein 2
MDSAGIVDQLMALERRPVQLLQQRQAELRKADDAWGSVNIKLSALRTALDKVRRSGAFDGFATATSSHPDIAAVTKLGSAPAGARTFTVASLATIHHVAAGDGFPDPAALVGQGRTMTLTKGGTSHALAITATTTYSDLARQINALDDGLAASVVKVADGRHQLVVASRATGEAQRFSISSDVDGADAATTFTTAADAVILLGSDPAAGGDASAPRLEVRRPTNSITDLVDGVRLDLRQAGGPVTVTTAQDTDAAAAAVKGVVDTVNGVVSTLRDLTKYDPTSKRGGVLQGDATARKIISDLNGPLTGIEGPTEGLVVAMRSGAQDSATVTLSGGFGDMISRMVRTVEGRDGSVSRARESLSSRIRSAQTSIDAYDVRLAARRSTLERKFAALETALARVSGQGGFLSGLLQQQQRR